jgi:hypothetical protein
MLPLWSEDLHNGPGEVVIVGVLLALTLTPHGRNRRLIQMTQRIIVFWLR